jgi:hypothetical protein
LTSFDVPPYGELFIGAGGVVLTFTIADADGFADWTDILVSPTLVGQNAVFQVFDVGTALLSAPAALQFL